MEISVVIPVYNAEQFLREAVESALAQPETAEVVLVEDGSSDDSLKVCEELSKIPKVILVTHPGGMNKGVAASRNVGIATASMPFIAFLDSDDLFVEGRFSITRRVFEQHRDADGVHEVIGTTYQNQALREGYLQKMGSERTGINISVSPGELFGVLASGQHGHISPDGLTLKRSSIDPDSAFDPELEMSEDSEFILRLAATRKLYQGDPERIVSLRRVHGQNSIYTHPRIMHFRRAYLQKCIDHQFYGSQDLKGALYIVSRRVGAAGWFQPIRKLGKFALLFKIPGITGFLLTRPKVILYLLRIALK